MTEKQKVCLTIAGVDPSGGAGIIADIKTFSAFGCFATAAIASLTFQNTRGVFGAVNQTAECVRRQAVPVIEDLGVDALKTGMLPTREIIDETASLIAEYGLKSFVCDPVVRSTSGFDLIDDAALAALIERLFPLASLITPNIPEAERITRMSIGSADDIRRAATLMQSMGAKNVLIKGGHLPIGNPDAPNSHKSKRRAIDFLFMEKQEFNFEADFIETTATHGTGCTFAAAIAANLANGKSLHDAVEASKRFVNAAIRTSPNLGHGHSPVNQLVRHW